MYSQNEELTNKSIEWESTDKLIILIATDWPSRPHSNHLAEGNWKGFEAGESTIMIDIDTFEWTQH